VRSHIDVIAKVRSRLRKDNDAHVLVTRSAGNLLIRAIAAFLALFLQFLFAKFLGANSFGDYVYALSWMSLLLLVAKCGIESAAIRFIAEYVADAEWSLLKGYVCSGITLVVILSFGMATVGYWLLQRYQAVFEVGALSALSAACVLLPVAAVSQTLTGYLRGYQHVQKADALDSLLRPIVMIAALPIALFALDIPATADVAIGVQFIGTTIVVGVVIVLLARAQPREVSIARFEVEPRKWLYVSGAILAAAGFDFLLFQVDTILIGTILGTREAGIYAMACNFVRLVIVVSLAVNTVFGPIAASCYWRGNVAGLTRTLRVALTVSSLSALAALIVLVASGKWLLSLVGEEFADGYSALCWLAVAHFFNATSILLLSLLTVTGAHYRATAIVGLAALINVILDVVLIPHYGILGAAIALVISMAIVAVLAGAVVLRRFQVGEILVRN
jgi:O-antigen/teichoic acid export membrane protein